MMRIRKPVNPVWPILLGSWIGILTFSVGCLILCLYLQRTREVDEAQTEKATEDSITGIPDIDIPIQIGTRQEEPEAPARERTWHKDGVWSGTGFKKTHPLIFDGYRAKLVWVVKGNGYTSVSLYKLRGSKKPEPIDVLMSGGSGTGETMIYCSRGAHYLEVASTGHEWHIEVFDYR